MIIIRYKLNGPVSLYDMIWACNLAMLLAIVGIYKNNFNILSSSMILISIDQVLWYIDLLGYLLTKKFFIGVS